MSIDTTPSKKSWYVPWPKCSDNCHAVDYLGASECDNVCPHKFTPLTLLTQKAYEQVEDKKWFLKGAIKVYKQGDAPAYRYIVSWLEDNLNECNDDN